MKSSSQQRGLTLVELMITLLIAAILLGLAVPGFNAFIRSNRAEVQSQSVINGLNYARSEAVKRGQSVRMTSLATGGSWQQGWRIWVDRNGNNAFDAANNEALQVVAAFSGDATLSTVVATEVIFDRLGNASASGMAAGTPVTFAFRLGTDYCRMERDIAVNHLGRVSMSRRSCP